MSWIALKMLMGDRAKFLGIVLGLTFAALVIMQQGSIFCGLMRRTAGQIIDITGADLWVMDPNVRHVDDVKPMIENSLYRVRGVDGVLWAVPLYKGQGRAKINSYDRLGKKQEVIEQAILIGLEDSSMVGAPPPERILSGSREALRRPDAILIDKNRLAKLFPNQPPEVYENYDWFVGKELEMNDHRAVIVGVCEATRTFQSNPVVYTTYARAKGFAPQERKILSYILAKTEPGLTSDVVARRIASTTGLGARTSGEFMWMTINYYLRYTGIPFNFGITALLGFLVGTAIAGQTFYNFTIENIKQFGALKAMGATNTRIVGMILLQAMVVGLLGYGIGVGLAALFGWRIQGTELAYFTPWQLLPISACAIVLICVLSSLVSVQRVIRLEPAIVFR